jgi:hypothetical protein
MAKYRREGVTDARVYSACSTPAALMACQAPAHAPRASVSVHHHTLQTNESYAVGGLAPSEHRVGLDPTHASSIARSPLTHPLMKFRKIRPNSRLN